MAFDSFWIREHRTTTGLLQLQKGIPADAVARMGYVYLAIPALTPDAPLIKIGVTQRPEGAHARIRELNNAGQVNPWQLYAQYPTLDCWWLERQVQSCFPQVRVEVYQASIGTAVAELERAHLWLHGWWERFLVQEQGLWQPDYQAIAEHLGFDS